MFQSKEFFELAKDSEDLVPKKYCWAKTWESHYRKEREHLNNLTFHLILCGICLLVSSLFSVMGFVMGLIVLSVSVAWLFGYLDARTKHENIKITLARIEEELGIKEGHF